MFRRLGWHSRLLFADEFHHRILIAIIELVRAEVSGFSLNDDVGEVLHFFRQFHIRNVLEVCILAANFIAIAQDGPDDAFAQRLQHDDTLAPRDDNPAEPNNVLIPHGVADDCEGLFSHALIGRDIIGRFEVARVNFGARHKFFDVDRVRALDLNCVQFIVVHQQKGILADGIALGLVLGLYDLARFGIDELAFDLVARFAIDGVERYP